MRSSGFDVPHVLGSMERELWRLLDELDSLLTDVAQDVYCARFATDVSGSIGEHVRHCLDHVSALLGADRSTTLSYDRREREPP